MLQKLLNHVEFTGLQNLILARVEPFGLHLFEFIFYCILGFFILLALRSFFRSTGMILFRPKKEDFLTSVTQQDYVQGQCVRCGWTGQVPTLRKRCPKCGNTAFV